MLLQKPYRRSKSLFKLIVEADLRPTEDQDRLLFALRNLVPELSPKVVTSLSRSMMRSEGDSPSDLTRLHSLLRKERILDAARRSLLRGLRGDELFFSLNKQAVFSGRVSFCALEEESPLGSIRFLVRCTNPSQLVEWLTPKTTNGRPLMELPQPIFN